MQTEKENNIMTLSIILISIIFTYFIGGFIYITTIRYLIKKGKLNNVITNESEEIITTIIWPISVPILFLTYGLGGIGKKADNLSWKIVEWGVKPGRPKKKLETPVQLEKNIEENVTYRDALCSECKQKKKKVA